MHVCKAFDQCYITNLSIIMPSLIQPLRVNNLYPRDTDCRICRWYSVSEKALGQSWHVKTISLYNTICITSE